MFAPSLDLLVTVPRLAHFCQLMNIPEIGGGKSQMIQGLQTRAYLVLPDKRHRFLFAGWSRRSLAGNCN